MGKVVHIGWLMRLIRHFHFRVPCQFCIAWHDEGGCASDATLEGCREEIQVALGLELRPNLGTYHRTLWTRDAIIDFLQRHSQDGRVQHANFNQTVYKAARREFGSWKAAIRAAGLKPPLQGRLAHRGNK